MKRHWYVVVCVASMIALSGCGQTNIFKGAHSRGSDKSPEALNADAQAELSNKNYAKAAEYFQEVVDKKPTDSVAQYGLAQASYGKEGVQLASILGCALDSINKSSGTSSAPEPDPSLTENYELVRAQVGATGTNFFDQIQGDQLERLYRANTIVIRCLKKIADGECDNVIPARNPSINLNLAVAQTLQAALFVLDSNNNGKPNEGDDFIRVTRDYQLDYSTATIKAQFDAHPGLKDTTKAQVVKSIVYLIGATKTMEIVGSGNVPADLQSWKGAIDYMQIALTALARSMPALENLKAEFEKLSGYETDPTNTETLRKVWGDIQSL